MYQVGLFCTNCESASWVHFRGHWRFNQQVDDTVIEGWLVSEDLYYLMTTVGLNGVNTFDSLGLSLHLVDRSKFIYGCFGLSHAFVNTVSPRLNFLFLMCFGMNLYAVWTERFKTVKLYTKVSYLFSRMF